MKRQILVFILGMVVASTFAVAATTTTTTPTPAKPKPVGEVVWVKGQVDAIAPDKTSRVLKRKDIIYEHETIKTLPGSQGQIVFSDSGLLALRENTEFRIDEYNYDKKGDPSKNKYVGELVKGGFRTITGAISKGHPENYKVTTPVATIGVRGTQFSAYCGSKKESCDYKLADGEVTVKNDHGELILNENNRYCETSSSGSPTSLKTEPGVFGSDPSLTPAQPSSGLMDSTGNSFGGSGGKSGGGVGGKAASGFCIS